MKKGSTIVEQVVVATMVLTLFVVLGVSMLGTTVVETDHFAQVVPTKVEVAGSLSVLSLIMGLVTLALIVALGFAVYRTKTVVRDLQEQSIRPKRVTPSTSTRSGMFNPIVSKPLEV
jgi:hypothetical protein